MVTVGVAIGTYGDRAFWRDHVENALASIDRQTEPATDFVWCHDASLAQARNRAIELLGDLDRVLVLDADDELDPGYIAAVATAAPDPHLILRPSTIGFYEDGTTDDAPVMIKRTDLKKANCIVIGAAFNPLPFFQVGGFRELPCLEDWDLWRRMVAAGCEVEDLPEAIYRVQVREGSRNSDEKLHSATYRRILKESPL